LSASVCGRRCNRNWKAATNTSSRMLTNDHFSASLLHLACYLRMGPSLNPALPSKAWPRGLPCVKIFVNSGAGQLRRSFL
jgi:hypothetical protein